MKNIFYCIIILFTWVLSALAQDVPRVISYQGVLVGADGKPESKKNVNFGFTFYDGQLSTTIVVPQQPKTLDVVGGLFNTLLEIPATANLNQEMWLEIEVNGNKFPNRIRMATALYALNIADNVVTSAKIKDGEVNAEDLSDMGASVGQVLTKTSTSWRGADIPKELPQALEGQILVFKNGNWQAEEPVIPSGVPVGTIVAFGGENIPDGWLLCDGRELNAAQNQEYKALFDAIGTAWGGNLSLQIFRIPDLQGMFLRGVDGDANEDPDKTTHRSSKYLGGNEGNKVGSYQLDAFQEHRHFTFNVTPLSNNGAPIANYPLDLSAFSSYVGDYEIPGPGRFATIIKTAGTGSTEPTVGPTSYPAKEFLWSSETRPKNVYVNYIIKVK